jgi:hypothetical protein
MLRFKKSVVYLEIIILMTGLLTGSSCTTLHVKPEAATSGNRNPLPSWNGGATKEAIIDFVNDLTTGEWAND